MQVEKSRTQTLLPIVLFWILIAAIVTWFSSCQFLPQIAPDDWAYHPLPAQVDTANTDTVATVCDQLIEVDQPPFVTLYILFDTPQTGITWQGGGVESPNLSDIINAVTSLPYTIYETNMGAVVIIRGTNDHQSFQTKVFARIGGAKWYMGTAKQGFAFPILTAAEYLEQAHLLPSVNWFSLWNTQYDSLEYIQIYNTILGECKKGRWKADFRQSPFETDTSIINAFIKAKWDNVLHN